MAEEFSLSTPIVILIRVKKAPLVIDQFQFTRRLHCLMFALSFVSLEGAQLWRLAGCESSPPVAMFSEVYLWTQILTNTNTLGVGVNIERYVAQRASLRVVSSSITHFAKVLEARSDYFVSSYRVVATNLLPRRHCLCGRFTTLSLGKFLTWATILISNC